MAEFMSDKLEEAIADFIKKNLKLAVGSPRNEYGCSTQVVDVILEWDGKPFSKESISLPGTPGDR